MTIWELIHGGAGRHEAVRLAGLAHRLASLPVPRLGAQRAERIAARVGFTYREPLVPVSASLAAAAFAVFALVVALAQTATPGSPLYTLRRGTNFVQSIVRPEPSATPQSSPSGAQSSASPHASVSPATAIDRHGATQTPSSGSGKVDDNPKASPSPSPRPTSTGTDDHGGNGKVQGSATTSPAPTPTLNPNSGGKNKP